MDGPSDGRLSERRPGWPERAAARPFQRHRPPEHRERPAIRPGAARALGAAAWGTTEGEGGFAEGKTGAAVLYDQASQAAKPPSEHGEHGSEPYLTTACAPTAAGVRSHRVRARA